ncbi:MAG: oxidoreductase [Desulfamplus sp.]|nr:oxidoreductase [Desulfamplus sp.]
MNNNIMIIGASGMVGTVLINLITKDNPYDKVIILTRRALKNIPDSGKFIQHIVDFNSLEQYRDVIKARTLVSLLGTTAKKAGPKDNFIKVDYGYPKQTALIARDNGTENIILVSAIGANPDSGFLYPATKGRLEQAVMQMGFKSVNILRPSLLLGNRQEFRVGEVIGNYFASGLSFMIPAKYKPVHAKSVAQKIIDISRNPVYGNNIFEGRAICE